MKPHIHQAKYNDQGKRVDECAKCGESYRNTDVHVSYLPGSKEHDAYLERIGFNKKQENQG